MVERTRTIPMLTVSAANKREHWGPRKRRVGRERAATAFGLHGFLPRTDDDLTITLTRIAPRALDTDNLASAFKAIRDEIALMLGRDDSPSAGITWVYEQRRGEPRQHAVEVTWSVGVHAEL